MHALHHSPPPPALTAEDVYFLRTVADDTEDAPWMVMNDRQWRGATALFSSLDVYARIHRAAWHPGGMLPLTYRPPGMRRRKQVAPDVFAATVPVRGRDSLPVDTEGMPPFVLEVVSGSSVQRDLTEKTEIYRLLGAQEYAIVRLDLAEPRLEGYRRTPAGAWEPWVPDAAGRLWSAVLGLWLLLAEDEIRAMTRAGELLPTLLEETTARQAEAQARAEAETAWQAEAQARAQAEAARVQAEEARQQAEEEAARLRAALERLTRGGEDKPSSTP